jgi:hypothetical protein
MIAFALAITTVGNNSSPHHEHITANTVGNGWQGVCQQNNSATSGRTLRQKSEY